MATMKALMKKKAEYGISVEMVPVPTIQYDTDVLIKVKAAGICGSDVHIYEWTDGYEWMAQYLPIIIGHEFSGQVQETGKSVTNIKPGDRVVVKPGSRCGTCFYCSTNRRAMCINASSATIGLRRNGGFAEFVVVPGANCTLMPDAMTYEEGALVEPLSVGAAAASKGEIKLGDTVAVMGPGPIGLSALAAAKALGAATAIMIGTSQDTIRFEIAKAFGADYIIEADKVDPVKAVLALTGGLGVQTVLEATGAASTIQQALNMVQKMSPVVAVGIYAKPVTFDLTSMVRSMKRLVTSYGRDGHWDQVINWVSTKKVDVAKMIDERISLDQAETAFERLVRKESVKSVFIF
ncbi:(R,R)-butanediol dehydrogenase [Deltaproteobacteria bacterium]|nr:(R,R)-butanediol dehydrogenase [Deltaproteobacteria bacterium]